MLVILSKDGPASTRSAGEAGSAKPRNYRHGQSTHDPYFAHGVSKVMWHNEVKELGDGKRRAGSHVNHGYSIAGREQDVIMYSDKRLSLRMFDDGFFVVVLWCFEMQVNMIMAIGVKTRNCSQAPGDAQACRFGSEHSAIRQSQALTNSSTVR
jgi:hypothetical protein